MASTCALSGRKFSDQPTDREGAMVLSPRSALSKIYVCHIDHEHDRTYTENVIEYLESTGAAATNITLNEGGLRPELQACLDDGATAILGYNSQLDRSWLPSGKFMEAAERHGVPVLHWILDHPSFRWGEFHSSTSTNSRFLLNSECERQYFQAHCLPGALTGTMGGVGPSRRSRIDELTRQSFALRPLACMIPLSLRRIRGIEQNVAVLKALDRPLGNAVRDAISRGQCDLIGPLQSHLAAALAAHDQSILPRTFNTLYQIVEQAVQTFRRLKIFAAARQYPVLIQSDDSAERFVQGAIATLATNVGMQSTLARMPTCRAVLSVSPLNDMIHDRTMNALNGGCVAIAEDSVASQALFKHKTDALLFRYDDDSLEECLDIVCNQPERAYEIAQAGMKLRDDPRVRFGQFHNIIDLARREVEFDPARARARS